MPQEYQTTHKQALDFLEKIVQKAGTFEPKKEIVPEENQLDDYLGKLEHFLRDKGIDYKYATRMAMHIRDIFKIHYWSDISKKGWDLLYNGIEKLSEPKQITRESSIDFGHKLLDENITSLPVTERAKKDIEKVKQKIKNL